MKAVMLIFSIISLSTIQFVEKVGHNKPIVSSFMLNNQDEKIKITKEELPAAARQTLNGKDFKDWSIVNAYKTKTSEYEVELKKEDTTQVVKFDKDGKIKKE
jgi:hypothetical protein